MEKKRICVVGAGISGLSALKNLLDAGITPCVFERDDNFGGTWLYSHHVGHDEHGLPVHSSIYKGVYTNIPTCIMTLPGMEFEKSKNSFLPSEDVLNCLREYAKKFDLQKHIKFHHFVKNIKPVDKLWVVQYKNLETGSEYVESFDGVMVCVGHYSVPLFPKINGLEKFKGKVIHSHDYKYPQQFTGQTVLVLGGGASGIDISVALATSCKKVFFSHRSEKIKKINYLKNRQFMPDIEDFGQNYVKFKDGTKEEINVAIFCTGYVSEYPFLDSSCHITVQDNHVQPLYRHLINIEHPTMCIVGLPYDACVIPMSDLQVRYFVEMIRGSFELPSKDEMYDETNAYYTLLWRSGRKRRFAHSLADDQQAYYDSLSREAGIEGLPPVFTKIHKKASQMFYEDILKMRKYNFIVKDSENYELKHIEE